MKPFLFVLPLLAVAGCSSNTSYVPTSGDASNSTTSTRTATAPAQAPVATAPVTDAPSTSETTSSAPKSAASNGQPSVPPNMAMSARMTLTPTPALDKKIADAQGGDKKKLAQAYTARGTFRMNDTAAAPRVIYRAALSDYRQALKLDPTNKEAQANTALIESIYKSMGRPIPTV